MDGPRCRPRRTDSASSTERRNLLALDSTSRCPAPVSSPEPVQHLAVAVQVSLVDENESVYVSSTVINIRRPSAARTAAAISNPVRSPVLGAGKRPLGLQPVEHVRPAVGVNAIKVDQLPSGQLGQHRECHLRVGPEPADNAECQRLARQHVAPLK